jgi:hypothetical protein
MQHNRMLQKAYLRRPVMPNHWAGPLMEFSTDTVACMLLACLLQALPAAGSCMHAKWTQSLYPSAAAAQLIIMPMRHGMANKVSSALKLC